MSDGWVMNRINEKKFSDIKFNGVHLAVLSCLDPRSVGLIGASIIGFDGIKRGCIV
jgi:hypothetical protein